MLRDFKLLPSATLAAGSQSAGFQNEDPYSKGFGQFIVDVTAISGTLATLTILIEGFDPTSGKYYTLLQSAGLTATGTTVLHLGPGLPATANVSANAILTRNFRVRFTITGTTPSVTFSVGASVA